MDENKQRNDFTGTVQDKPSGDILNPFTGQYRKDTDDAAIAKVDIPLWPSISKRDSSESADEEIEKFVPIYPVEKGEDEQIVCGIVYEPDTTDAQGDSASADEIRKAAYDFMESVQTFKVMHKGRAVNVKVLESYVTPQDIKIAGKAVKKGSWVLVTKILDKKLWEAIKDGTYTGYSISGYAKIT